ncbi:hypothetical protein [Chryseobacterium terrae]|uniref:RadC-like JAB domain-containing protein n=1 Tax=Chryseobacterium terrae TaxID=3163299 RepID=A0ABW8XZ78_9FLAO
MKFSIKVLLLKKTEKRHPKIATKEILPILAHDSETKTIAVDIIFAPKSMAKILLIETDDYLIVYVKL